MQFVFDLDGTICFGGRPLTEEMIQALETCLEDGHEVIFASARPIRDILPVIPKSLHSGNMVGGNGAFIQKEGQISVSAFDDVTKEALLRCIEHHNLTYLVDSKWDYAYTGSQEHPIFLNIDPLKLAKCLPITALQKWVKLVLFTSDNKIIDELRQLPVSLHIHSGENIVDISPVGIDKWSGLQELGVKEGEYIAFGNDANDITMFQHAKESVAVGSLKAIQPFASEFIIAEQVVEKVCKVSKEYRTKQFD
ncbi:MAG: HAD-IIB family hydrolase [Lysinibacillus sp.]